MTTAMPDRAMDVQPLEGLHVVDLSTWIAGAYCTKLLADAGAIVTKIEPPARDPMRRWSASGTPIEDGADGPLYRHLHAVDRSHVVDPDSAVDMEFLHGQLASADAVIWSRGSAVAEHPSSTPQAILAAHPHLAVTAITSFGLDGPWADKPATEFTLQAWSGGMIGLGRGDPDRTPVHVGGQVGEWLSGVTASIGTLASLRRASDSGIGELVDVSMLEVISNCLTYYPVTFHDRVGRPMRKKRYVPTPGVSAASDGLVGLGCGTGQQWLDVCAMVGHPEWMEDRSLFLERTALAPAIDAWVADQTVAEVLDLATAFRIPNAPIANGENLPDNEHLAARDTFTTDADGTLRPKPPVRITSSGHAVGETATTATTATSGPMPFSGLRVLDMTAYWAGPSAGHLLAMLGAEVIHLESTSRPDGARLIGGVPQTEDRYWEQGPIFAALNTNKQSLTIDFRKPEGVDLLRRFSATCDVVIENYTPRVLEHIGVDYEALRAIRDDLIMVRMPGFGLDGPWRDNAAFAFVIENAAGLTWMTGHSDQNPLEPYCIGDSNAGLHAAFGVLLALQHRDRTGEGCLVEAAMIDAGLNISAEQVIEYSANGVLLGRNGNRGPAAAPQNLYPCADTDEYGRDAALVAIAVATDGQWWSLRVALGEPDWAMRADLDTHDGRVAAHDEIDAELEQWCRARTVDDVIDALWDAGIPVGKVLQPHRQPDLPQLHHRRFFEELEHPIMGSARYSTPPIRFSNGPERYHTRHAPLLGEHNTELLGELGLDDDEIGRLEADGVIGSAL